MKNFNWTRDFLACSTMPQPNVLPCVSICMKCQVWISKHRPALHQYFQMKSVLHFLGQYVTDNVHRPCNQVCTNFLKIYEPLRLLGVRKNDMRTTSYSRSTSTRSHNTKFGHHSKLAPGICALLLISKYFSINIIRFTHQFLGLHLCSTFYNIYIL
jgi:hypothetical protein